MKYEQMIMCLNCRKITRYKIIEMDDTVKIKDKLVHYKRHAAICQNCGQEVWAPEVDDYNAEEPWKIYKKNNN